MIVVYHIVPLKKVYIIANDPSKTNKERVYIIHYLQFVKVTIAGSHKVIIT